MSNIPAYLDVPGIHWQSRTEFYSNIVRDVSERHAGELRCDGASYNARHWAAEEEFDIDRHTGMRFKSCRVCRAKRAEYHQEKRRRGPDVKITPSSHPKSECNKEHYKEIGRKVCECRK